jgi:GT2 family glycosyltransferase
LKSVPSLPKLGVIRSVSAPFEISVVVSTYQRPGHLRRCLQSLAAQQGVDGQFEVIVVDDGSQDETPELVAQFRRDAAFPVKFSTHPHEGFQLARCRNSGIRASTAPYLLFTDGDCIFPADHLRRHLDARRPGMVRAGDCIRLDEPTSARIDESAIRSGEFLEWVTPTLRKSLRRIHLKSLGYQFVRHANRPKLVGWNMAVWRDQLERINGFDEQFCGWGCEDDDLASRLRRSGARIATALGYTCGYHLWHPPHSTTPQQWSQGPNVAYFQRPVVLTRCLEGIRRRSLQHLSTRLVGSEQLAELTRQLSQALRESTSGVELELLLWPGRATFSSRSACRVLAAPVDADIPAALERSAHAVLRVDPRQAAPAVLDGLHRLLRGQESTPTPSRLAA